MTKDSKRAIDTILALGKSAKRARESSAEIKARGIRTLDARWPHFIEELHDEFREFVDRFNAGRADGTPSVKATSEGDSITAASGRMSVTVVGDLDALMVTKRYATRRAHDTQTSELPFYVRLGEDNQIEIHDSPADDRLIPLDAFLVGVLAPFFAEVVKSS